MIIHLFKLIVNKRRQNFFLLLQLFICYLALFLFFGLNIRKFSNYFKPLGYKFENAWLVKVDLKNVPIEKRANYIELVKDKLSSIREVNTLSQPEIVPFDSWEHEKEIKYDGKVFKVKEFKTDEAFKKVLDIEMISGKWLPDRNMTSVQPIVVTRTFASLLFADESPLGKTVDLITLDALGTKTRVKAQITGLVEEFRVNVSANSEPAYFINSNVLSEPIPRFLLRSEYADQYQLMENKIRSSISKIGSDDIEIVQNMPLSLLKKYAHKTDYIQLSIAFIIFIFLVINIFIGVTGVFTYNLSKRSSEIGLRIAMGATATDIRRQLWGETFALTSIGIFPAVLIAVQLIIMRYFEPYMTTSYGILSLLMSALFLYLLMLSCALYPSLKASGIKPAEALHED